MTISVKPADFIFKEIFSRVPFRPGNKVVKGFVLSTLAGMMTVLSGLLVYIEIPHNHMRLASCFCLATASGVMTYIALVRVLGEAQENFEKAFDGIYSMEEDSIKETKVQTFALVCASATFFAGWFLAIVMDWARV